MEMMFSDQVAVGAEETSGNVAKPADDETIPMEPSIPISPILTIAENCNTAEVMPVTAFTKADAIAASSSTMPFPVVMSALGLSEPALASPEAQLEAVGEADLQETVRQVRREIKKSANWQVLPPIMEGQQLDTAPVAPSKEPSREKTGPTAEVGTELLASGVTYALTLCSDLVQQLSKVEERMRQVEDKTTRMSTEVTACFHRTELLREMVEMEQGVRSQDVVQLQTGLKQAADGAEKTQVDIEGRQADLATFLTGNIERLAVALDKRAQKLDKDVAELHKLIAQQAAQQRVSPVSKVPRVSPATEGLSREMTWPGVSGPRSCPVILEQEPLFKEGREVDVMGREKKIELPMTPEPMSRPGSTSPSRDRGMDVPAERPVIGITVPSTSRRPTGGLMTKERTNDMDSGRWGDDQRSLSRPARPNPDADDRDADFSSNLLPREWTTSGLTWKCTPSTSLLCRVATQDPSDWQNQEADFVTVEAASIWV